MRKYILIAIGVAILGFGLIYFQRGSEMVSPLAGGAKREKPYDKYSFERLSVRTPQPSAIEIVEDKFYYRSEGRRISGQIMIPEGTQPEAGWPVVVMARGYVEKEGYKTGDGTRNAASVYSRNGYLTLAPDFSGYGESDAEDENALGARLVKPVEILDLIASLDHLSMADTSHVYLWGHSNGGQIMISVAEILGQSATQVLGATLWAPVSKPFPYNILYYTDDAEDRGKWLRSEIAKFESDYDVFLYSIDRYLSWIKMPLLIHQGTLDDAVPKVWSDQLAKSLEELEKEATYHIYPGADHNMRPNWNQVVARDMAFFASLN